MHDSLKYIHHNGRASGGFSLFQSSSHSNFIFLIFPNEPQSGVTSKQRTASFGNVSSLVRHWSLAFIGRFELSKVQRTFALGTPPVQMYICTFGVRAYAPLSIWVLSEAGVVAGLVVGRKDQVWLHTPSQQLQLSIGRLWYTIFAPLVPVLWVHLQDLY